jgi:LacI family transcriptional regulator/LacI family repressor for deo operon, udp, cdd, tsx, nupC, and nupG
MARRTVSIQDVAHAAGVSHTTVSRALRDSPLISAEVRQKIHKLAQEMGYIPNAVAQSLRGQRTNTIGLVVTTIADPFVGRVVRGIEAVAQKFNLTLILSVSDNDADREIAVIENLHRRRVDGIIIAAAQLTGQHEKRLAEINAPTVLINHQAEVSFEHLHSVSVDDYSGAYQAVEYLAQNGHRAIGYLGAGNRARSNRARLRGYHDALAAAGIEASTAWERIAPAQHRYHSDDVRAGQQFLPELIAAGVTAVFCFNDMVAVGALLACRTLGVSVPEQLSLVGFDDIELAQFVTPPLTSVHQPKLRLGQMAMEMLLDLLDDRPVQDHVLPTDLVVRGSTGAAPAIAAKEALNITGAIHPDQLFISPL